MPTVVGVSFRKAGKIYYFGPKDLDIKEGDYVVTVTQRGSKLGYVAQGPKEVDESEIVGTLKDVERIADEADIAKDLSHREREEEAMAICEEKIKKHGLPMELLTAELSFDETMITFSFSAEGRVDFRELVKDIAAALHLKIQLLQIGVRDKAKLVGGYGSCGQPLCCHRFLTNFEPVSMKMAKDQSLFLNPAKFSGCCGKLMCCLKYEHEFYSAAQKALPNSGVTLMCEHGPVRVKDYNLISNTVILENEEGAIVNMPIAKVVPVGVCKKHGIRTENCTEECVKVTQEDLDYLEVNNVKESKEETTFSTASAFEGKSINFDNFRGLLDDDVQEEPQKPKKPKKNSQRETETKDRPEPRQSRQAPVRKAGKDGGSPKPFRMGKGDLSELGITFRDVDEKETHPQHVETARDSQHKPGNRPRPFGRNKGRFGKPKVKK
ncbi:MAG: stage 0 sporulation family protein [Armatimonadetes bacterium]|nr:stage 0 sporulation family protein [Candidatus Hippobium faecium]